jgi:diketogulonate reductase-like aldo/keto reductase
MSQPVAAPIFKAIPSTGQMLPVVGWGTNAFRESMLEQLREGMQHFACAGAMIDTAAVYGESEQVIGRLAAELKLRDKLFIASKITTGGGSGTQMQPGGRESLDRSLARLQTDHVELLYVHNLIGVHVLLPLMLEWKKERRLRYTGVSTSYDAHHAEIVECMQKYALDFVQVNYGLGGRAAEQTVLKAAVERRVAVIANVPLGGRGGRNLQAVQDRPLPDWAARLRLHKLGPGHAEVCGLPPSGDLRHQWQHQGRAYRRQSAGGTWRVARCRTAPLHGTVLGYAGMTDDRPPDKGVST